MSGNELRVKGTGRAEQLQFLRFLAFFNVFFEHTSMWNFTSYPTNRSAWMSMVFFFLLGGLVTGYNGVGRVDKPSGKLVAKYMWKKIAKIYPAYFVILIMHFVFSDAWLCLVSYEFQGFVACLPVFLRHLFLVQSWWPLYYFFYTGVGWFFSTILFLYLLNLPGVYLLNKINAHPKKKAIFSGAFLGILAGIVIYQYAVYHTEYYYYFQYVFPIGRMGEYILGMILGFLLRQKLDASVGHEKNAALYTVLEVAALALWYGWLALPYAPWADKVVHWLIPDLVLLTVFTIGAGGVSRIFRWKPLVRLGDITMECVLAHNIVIMWYVKIYQGAYSQETKLTSLLALTGCLLMTVALSWLIHGKPRK